MIVVGGDVGKRWLTTTVLAEPADAFIVGPVRLSVDETAGLAHLPYPDLRPTSRRRRVGSTTSLGVALVLVRKA